MNDNLIKQLTNLSKQLGADRLISEDDKKEILNSIIAVLAQFKGEVENVNTETVKAVNKVLKQIQVEHDRYVEEAINTTEKTKTKVTEAVTGVMKELENVKKLCQEVMDSKPEDGDDADEEYIIEEVIKKLKPLEQNNVVSDDGTEIVAKINSLSLENENKIDFSHIKNAPEFKNGRWSGITKGAVLKLIQESGGAGVTLKVGGTNNVDQGTLDLIAGSGITIVDNGDGTVTFTSTGGSGSGDVVGPASSTDNAIVRYDGTTGKLIQNSAATIADTTGNITAGTYNGNTIGAGSTSGTNTGDQTITLTGDVTGTGTGTFATTIKNDVALGGNPTTATQSAGDNTTKIATTAFVTTAVANGTIGLLDYRGSYDASSNLFPATGGSGIAGAILQGDFWICSVGGTLGSTAVTPGDLIISIVDTPGQTSTNWDLIEHNLGTYVTSVTGTTNRITSTGGATPAIDISATFEALLGKVANPLSQFASTTSAQLASTISDETGSGALVFGTDPTFTTRINTPEVKATSSAGISFKNSSGTETILTGAGGGTGTSITGTTNIGTASADYLQLAGGTGSTTQTATGSSSNIDINLVPKGTGIVKGELKRFMVRLVEAATDQATGTTIGGDYRISNRAITIKAVGSYCDTAGTTGTYTVDINEAGTTILSTKITVDSTEKSSETAATAPVISDASIAADAIITFDVDAVQTTKAKGLVVWVDYVYA